MESDSRHFFPEYDDIVNQAMKHMANVIHTKYNIPFSLIDACIPKDHPVDDKRTIKEELNDIKQEEKLTWKPQPPSIQATDEELVLKYLKIKVVELKKIARDYKLHVSGTKQQLITRIVDYEKHQTQLPQTSSANLHSSTNNPILKSVYIHPFTNLQLSSNIRGAKQYECVDGFPWLYEKIHDSPAVYRCVGSLVDQKFISLDGRVPNDAVHVGQTVGIEVRKDPIYSKN